MATPEKIIIDAKGRSFGRIASEVAHHLRGKHLATFRPNVNPKVTVEVINIRDARFTGKKMMQKMKVWYTGYPGGLRKKSLRDRWAQSPSNVLHESVRSMLPANRLRSDLLKNLIVKS